MTYEHPNYVPWTINTGFSRGLSDDPNAWRSFVVSSNIKAAATRTVERRRREGPDPGDISSMGSGYTPPSATAGPSNADKMRAALKSGPKTAGELAQIAGIKVNDITAYMRRDVARGMVVRIGAKKTFRYALAGDTA